MLEQVESEYELKQMSSTEKLTDFQQGKKILHKADIEVFTLIKNAQTLLKHNETEMALNLLRQASNQDSSNIFVLKLISDTLRKKNTYKEELQIRLQILRLDYSFENIALVGECYYLLNQDHEAQNYFFEALSVVTEDSYKLFDVYRQLGNIFVRNGDFDSAEEYYNKSYAKDSKSEILLVNLGTLEIQKNDFEKALFCFRKAVEINKNCDKAWIGLAMVHRTYGDFDLAWANVKRANEINPYNKTAILLIANWSVSDHKISFAVQALQEYLSHEDYDTEIALLLINFFFHTGKVKNAQLEIERFLLWNPKNEEVLNLKKKLKGG